MTIEWEDGSCTFEPLYIIGADCPVICAQYANHMGLLDRPGWKCFKNIAKREKLVIRMLNQAKLSSFWRATIYQFGFKVPRSPQEAIKFNEANGNTHWQAVMALEMSQFHEYQTFQDPGKGTSAPEGYRKI